MDDFSKHLILGIAWALILPIAVPYVIILLAPIFGMLGAVATATVLFLIPAWVSDSAHQKSQSQSPKASPQFIPEPKTEFCETQKNGLSDTSPHEHLRKAG